MEFDLWSHLLWDTCQFSPSSHVYKMVVASTIIRKKSFQGPVSLLQLFVFISVKTVFMLNVSITKYWNILKSIVVIQWLQKWWVEKSKLTREKTRSCYVYKMVAASIMIRKKSFQGPVSLLCKIKLKIIAFTVKKYLTLCWPKFNRKWVEGLWRTLVYMGLVYARFLIGSIKIYVVHLKAYCKIIFSSYLIW